MKITDEMVNAASRAMCVNGDLDPDENMPNDGPRWKYYAPAARAALTAALAVQTQQGVEVKDWHRSDNAYGGVMLYSLREDGWRKGAPVMVNDVTIRIERATGSETDIEPIVQRIRSALVDVPAVESEPVALIEREVLAELAKHKTATGTVCSPLVKSKFGDKVPLFAHPPSSSLIQSDPKPARSNARAEVDDEVEILERLADGDTIVFSMDGDMAWFTKGDRAFVGNAIMSLREKGYLLRKRDAVDDDDDPRGIASYDTISDAGRAALSRKGSDSHTVERCRDCDGYNCDDGCAYPVSDAQTVGGGMAAEEMPLEAVSRGDQKPVGYVTAAELANLKFGVSCVDLFGEVVPKGFQMVPLFEHPPEANKAPILRGVGKINGDGWKDSTKKGEIVFVWNREHPKPYAPSQYPRVGREHWSASTEQYDFSPATLVEIEALFNPAPEPSDGAPHHPPTTTHRAPLPSDADAQTVGDGSTSSAKGCAE